MTGQRIGYIRVSTFDQNPERQLEHVEVDRIFSDKASGSELNGCQFSRLLHDIDLPKMLPFASFFDYILCPFFRL
jgi:DNA invertase Pin-like site-specific DNA recombinase